MKDKKIDKNIPIPRQRRGMRLYARISWELMEIGDSFHCSTDKELNSTTASGKRYGEQTGKKFTRRKNRSADGKPLPGGRIWRIE